MSCGEHFKVHILLLGWGGLGLPPVIMPDPLSPMVLPQSAANPPAMMVGETSGPPVSLHHAGIPSPHASGFPLSYSNAGTLPSVNVTQHFCLMELGDLGLFSLHSAPSAVKLHLGHLSVSIQINIFSSPMA